MKAKKFAEEPGMIPKGLQVRLTGSVLCLCLVLIARMQVWFQNRRAMTMTQIRKAERPNRRTRSAQRRTVA